MKNKRQRIQWRKLLRMSAWVLLAAGTGVVLIAARQQHLSATCSATKINIDRSNDMFFVDEQDIEQIIAGFCGDSLQSTKMYELDFARLETQIEQNPYVLRTEIFSPEMGQLQVNVKQRQPLMRVINSSGVSYYIDEYGEMVPLSPKFTTRVPVVSGNIPTVDVTNVEDDTTILHDVYALMQYIRKDEFLQALTEQVYVTEAGELELVPRVGDFVFVLGSTDELEKKFTKLRIFYKEVGRSANINKYKSIDLKYHDQIVCTKK